MNSVVCSRYCEAALFSRHSGVADLQISRSLIFKSADKWEFDIYADLAKASPAVSVHQDQN